MELTCPKCHGAMRTYERNGVHVDQCTDCRGLFLDRGELERLVEAENGWYGAGPAAAPPPSSGRGIEGVVADAVRQATSRGHSSHRTGGYPKRKKSFLQDLFD
ncbi:MAG TPA: zf-TFIIB domain-containing protein [Mycobacteriales bacterium]|nr:zf-TFIIB domain-containing protein [Mycobacteriales bacterium]